MPTTRKKVVREVKTEYDRAWYAAVGLDDRDRNVSGASGRFAQKRRNDSDASIRRFNNILTPPQSAAAIRWQRIAIDVARKGYLKFERPINVLAVADAVRKILKESTEPGKGTGNAPVTDLTFKRFFISIGFIGTRPKTKKLGMRKMK